MKMGRSIYTVERSKAVPWMYLSNIYICILLYVFLSTFLSHTYNTALSGELNYPEFFSTQIAFFLFARNFFFPFLLPSNRRIFISAHPRVSHSNPRIRSFSTRRKVSFAIYWNFSLALEEIFTKDGNIIKEKLSMHEIRWKRYEIEFQQLSYWDFFFSLMIIHERVLLHPIFKWDFRSETGREYYSISFFLSNVSFVNSIFS